MAAVLRGRLPLPLLLLLLSCLLFGLRLLLARPPAPAPPPPPEICVRATWWPVGCADVAVENLGDALVPVILRAALERAAGKRVSVRRAEFSARGKLVMVGSELHAPAYFLQPGDVLAGMGTKLERADVNGTAGDASAGDALLLATRGRLSMDLVCPGGPSAPCTAPSGIPLKSAVRVSVGDPVLAMPLLFPSLYVLPHRRTCLALAIHLHQHAAARILSSSFSPSGRLLPSAHFSAPDLAALSSAGLPHPSLQALESTFGCLRPVYMAFTPSTAPALDLVLRLTSARAVVSGSLHGAALADAYGVPSRVLLPPGGSEPWTKFADYYSGVGHAAKGAVREAGEVLAGGFEAVDAGKVGEAGRGWLEALQGSAGEVLARIAEPCGG